MKKICYLFISIILLTGCITQKQRNKICQTCPSYSKDSIVYRDTIITVPGDSAYIIDTLWCDSLGRIYSQRINEKDGEILNLTALLKNNKYYIRGKSDTIYVPVKGNTVVHIKREQLPPIVERRIPWWIYPILLFSAISLIYFSIRYGPKILRFLIKISTGL